MVCAFFGVVISTAYAHTIGLVWTDLSSIIKYALQSLQNRHVDNVGIRYV